MKKTKFNTLDTKHKYLAFLVFGLISLTFLLGFIYFCATALIDQIDRERKKEDIDYTIIPEWAIKEPTEILTNEGLAYSIDESFVFSLYSLEDGGKLFSKDFKVYISEFFGPTTKEQLEQFRYGTDLFQVPKSHDYIFTWNIMRDGNTEQKNLGQV
jgi:hypothetical protein